MAMFLPVVANQATVEMIMAMAVVVSTEDITTKGNPGKTKDDSFTGNAQANTLSSIFFKICKDN